MNNWQKVQPGASNEVSLFGKKFTVYFSLIDLINPLEKVTIPKRILESRHIDVKESTQKEVTEETKSNEKESSSEESSDNESTTDTNSQKEGESDSNLSNILSDFHLQERGLFQDINVYKIFRGERLHSIWKLWELVLTNQPLLIISDSPSESR